MIIKEYRPVPGYEGLYELAADGSVRSLDRVSINGSKLKGRNKTLHGKHNGYSTVKLTKDGKTIGHSVKELIEKTYR